MKIAIHHRKNSYSNRWIEFCKEKGIEYKVVNAYDSDIIEQLKDCDIFLWHHHHNIYKDNVFAKELLFSLQQSGKTVFPDFNTGWHFDDKLGQKYLFEAHGINIAKAWAFYDKKTAYDWINQTSFPKVFKLRGGAGSSNVYLVKDKSQAKRLVNKAFGSGFKTNYLRLAFDRLKLWISGKGPLLDFFKYMAPFIFPRKFNKHLIATQKGYIYFQEFIVNEGCDYRVEIVGDKAITMIRNVRKGDFRASGSNNINKNPSDFPKDVLDFCFDITDKLGLQAAALDVVKDIKTGKPYLIECSYCYGVDDDEFDHGYWTKDGIWHNEPFNGLDWMIQFAIEQAKNKNFVKI